MENRPMERQLPPQKSPIPASTCRSHGDGNSPSHQIKNISKCFRATANPPFPAMATAYSLLQGSGNDRFNAEATAWDSNPLVHQASKAAFEAIRARFPQLQLTGESGRTDGLDVLEIGCGTGLLTMLVAPHVRTIVAVDAAQGMIDVLKAKLD